MIEPNQSQPRWDIEKAEAEFEAASTRDEKLAVLKKYLPPEDAECWLESMLNPDPHIGCVHLYDTPVDEPVAR
jgi:hypothetical protein